MNHQCLKLLAITEASQKAYTKSLLFTITKKEQFSV